MSHLLSPAATNATAAARPAAPKALSLLLAMGLGLTSALAPLTARADEFTRERNIATALQLALPIAAGVCAFRQHRQKDFLAAVAVESVTVQGLKYGLGSASINQRPRGGTHGFPSGHAALAMLGATDLARKCLPDRPVLGALAYGTALAVAASRVRTRDHTGGQAIAGLAIGYFSDGITVAAGNGFFGLGYQMDF